MTKQQIIALFCVGIFVLGAMFSLLSLSQSLPPNSNQPLPIHAPTPNPIAANATVLTTNTAIVQPQPALQPVPMPIISGLPATPTPMMAPTTLAPSPIVISSLLGALLVGLLYLWSYRPAGINQYARRPITA